MAYDGIRFLHHASSAPHAPAGPFFRVNPGPGEGCLSSLLPIPKAGQALNPEAEAEAKALF